MWESFQSDKENTRGSRAKMMQDVSVFVFPFADAIKFNSRIGIADKKWSCPRVVVHRTDAEKMIHSNRLDMIITLSHGVSVWVRVNDISPVLDKEGEETDYVQFLTGTIPDETGPSFGWDLFSGG